MNTQPIEKQNLGDGTLLDVISIFRTIQGEGPYAGSRAIFVRLAGCNLQCPGCDTDYTSSRDHKTIYDICGEIARLEKEEGASGNRTKHLVVISGGEPFRQNISPVVQILLSAGYPVQIETNGTLFVDLWSEDENNLTENLTVVCSPKSGKLNADLFPHIDALKYVISAYSSSHRDGLPLHVLNHPTGTQVFRPPPEFTGQVFIQPADECCSDCRQKNLEAAIYSCRMFGYTLCLQLHKMIGLP